MVHRDANNGQLMNSYFLTGEVHNHRPQTNVCTCCMREIGCCQLGLYNLVGCRVPLTGRSSQQTNKQTNMIHDKLTDFTVVSRELTLTEAEVSVDSSDA